MQRLKHMKKIGLCLLLLGSPSCGSWSGNPPSAKVETVATGTVDKRGTVEVVLQGAGTTLRLLDNSLAVTDKNGQEAGKISLKSAQLVLDGITIRKDKTDTAQPSLNGPFLLDLMSNTVSPALPALTLPVGSYKDISMRLTQAPGVGGSLLLTGTYIASNQTSSYVKIQLDVTDEISFMKTDDSKVIKVTDGANAQVIVRFQLGKWFNFKGKDLDLSAFVGKDLTIDNSTKASDQKLRTLFLSNVKTATDFESKDAASNRPSSGSDKGRDDWWPGRR